MLKPRDYHWLLPTAAFEFYSIVDDPIFIVVEPVRLFARAIYRLALGLEDLFVDIIERNSQTHWIELGRGDRDRIITNLQGLFPVWTLPITWKLERVALNLANIVDAHILPQPSGPSQVDLVQLKSTSKQISQAYKYAGHGISYLEIVLAALNNL